MHRTAVFAALALALCAHGQTHVESALAASAVQPGANAVTTGAFAHFADGGGWTTTFFITNLDANRSTPFNIFFVSSQGTPVTLTTRTVHDGVTRTVNALSGTIDRATTLVIETLGGGSDTTVGWVDVQGTSLFFGFGGYAVFRQHVPGRTDLEATVPLETRNRSAFAFFFDNRNGFVHGVAVMNANNRSQAEIIVRLIGPDGSTLGTELLVLPPLNHTSFVLTDRYPVLKDRIAGIEFEERSGTGLVSGVALRFSPAGTLTTVPVFTSN